MMAHLLQDLTFIDHDANGREYHRVFPAGTPVHEPRDLQSEDAKICAARCKEYASKGDRGFAVMILDAMPRTLHRRFWDSSFVERDSANSRPQSEAKENYAPTSLGQQYGVVAIVDLMNLLIPAYHAGPPSRINGVRSLLQTCANIIEKLSPEYLIFADDSGHAERTAAFPGYKSHRPPKPAELIEQIALAEKAITAIGWPLIRVRDWEADDVIASLVTSIGPRSAGVVVASGDKDLFQLCEEGKRVKIYHPWDGGKFLGGSHVEEKYGIKRGQFADYLALVGDKSDGIPGVSGIGKKKAAELLGKYPDLTSILEAGRCLHVAGSAGKALREQAEVARLSRQLVELNRGLVIPSSWHDYPANSPTAGWVEALRRLDLGAAATRLCDVLPASGPVRSHSSLIEVTHAQSNQTGATVLSHRRDVATVPAIRDRSDDTAKPTAIDSERPVGRTAGNVTSVEVVANIPEPKLAVSTGTGTCIACGGTGRNSRGGECRPCAVHGRLKPVLAEVPKPAQPSLF